MDVLNTKIKSMLTEKTLKVRPENIKSGETIFGIAGTVDETLTNAEYVQALELSNIILGTDLPYTALEYIESTGTQWINTNVMPNENTKLDIDFSFTENTTNGHTQVFGSRENWQSKGFYFGVQSDTLGNGWWGQFNSSNTGALSAASDRNRHTVSFSKNVYLDNTLVKTFTGGLTPYTYIALFGSFEGNTTAASCSCQKLYSCKIYSGESLLKDLVPAKTLNDVVCLYDKVSKTFIYNSGTGDFVAGPVIEEG